MNDAVRRLRKRAFVAQAARKTGARQLAAFGKDSLIVPPATIRCPHRIEIGEGVLIAENASLFLVERYAGREYQPSLRIGDGTLISHGVWFSCVGEITVGANVLIGHGVLISDSFHQYADRDLPIVHQPMAPARPVLIADGSIVGPGAAVLAGVTIGEGSYIAPNAVVADDVPPHSVAAGNPASVIRRWDQVARHYRDAQDPRWAGMLKALSE